MSQRSWKESHWKDSWIEPWRWKEQDKGLDDDEELFFYWSSKKGTRGWRPRSLARRTKRQKKKR